MDLHVLGKRCLMTILVRTETLTAMQAKMVVRWHSNPIDNLYSGFLGTACQQHAFNFQLWHEEDRARSPTASDADIAAVKRSIDRLNQQRNDWIERLDDELSQVLAAANTRIEPIARQNSETVGSVIDRLSILALREYHYHEQTQRLHDDVAHRERLHDRLSLCRTQLLDLTDSLQALFDDLFAGRLRHKIYRQMKMYNDPKLNPYLYNQVM